MKKSVWIGIIILVILLVIVLYPKDCGYGVGGLIPLNVTLHSEKCDCFGVKYTAVGGRFNMFGFMMCADCGPSYYCIGFPTGKKCYETIFNENSIKAEKEVECKK